MQRKRGIFSVVLALVICLCWSFTAFAQSDEAVSEVTVQPRWTYTGAIRNSLAIASNGEAHVDAAISAYTTANSVKIVSSLQQYKNGGWYQLTSWEVSNNSTYAALDRYYYVAKGYSYRVVTNYYVYKNGVCVESLQDTYSSYY